MNLNFESSKEYNYCKANIIWDDMIIGYCILSLGKDYIWINILNINPEFQRCGYGRKLIEFLTSSYNVRGEHTVTSVGFYEKIGAKIKGNEFYFKKLITI